MNFLADTLMLIHFLWVVFMIVGLPLGIALRSPVLRWAHCIGMLITAFFASAGMYCPLTTWEEGLRRAADPAFTYRGSFLARHLGPILYPDLSPAVIRSVSVAWFALTLIAMAVWKPGRTSRKKSKVRL